MHRRPTYEELKQRVEELELQIEGYREVELKRGKHEKGDILDSISEHVIYHDTEQRVLWANRAAAESVGAMPGELVGRYCYEIWHQRAEPCEDCPVIEAIRTGSPHEREGTRLDGRIFFMRGYPFRDAKGEIIGAVEVTEEITERKLAEAGLRDSEERYRGLFENSTDFIYTLDLEGSFTEVNRAAERLTGYTKKELVGMNYKDYTPSDDHEKIFDAFNRVFVTGIPLQDFPLEVIIKDGTKKYFETSATILRRGEEIIGFQGSSRDVTARVHTEEALRESEEKYRSLFEQSRDAIVITSERGGFVDANRSGLELFGYTRDEMTKINFQRLYVDPNDGYRFQKEMDQRGFVGDFETRLRKKDGTVMDCLLSVVRQRAQQGAISRYQGVIRDITDQRRLQAQLQHAQTMEAIATLAGGIAHQFNNALTSIIGYAGLLEMDFLNNEKVMKYVQAMKTSAHRMAHLTGQLLAYARGGKYNPQTLSLTNFIEDTLPLIQHTIQPDIRVETDLPVDTWGVEADRTQMQLVLSAIMANSNEAIEGPGRIRVSTRNLELDHRQLSGHPGARPGPYVRLSIQDDGKGMDEETKGRIFEPFFTTHFIGRGLGMASVYGIVSNHRGWIEVDSEPGKGTEVRIYLPAFGPEAEIEAGEGAMPGTGIELPGGQGIVLVIEDEEDVMRITRVALERLGYRVLEARTGGEAVEIARTFDGDIDLALLDIRLPDMSGGKVYPLIMEARPKLRVIVCSGYAIDGPAREIIDAGAENFIQKPFLVSTLAEKLKEALEGK